MITFQIADDIPTAEINTLHPTLEAAAEAALKFAAAPPSSELSLVITGDEQIRQLNAQYLGINAPTDVLSFPVEEIDPESGNKYIGDVIIAFPYTQEQAKSHGHTLADEMQLLVVHGVLHLLGYDHGNEIEKSRMWAAQAEILHGLGCPDDLIPTA